MRTKLMLGALLGLLTFAFVFTSSTENNSTTQPPVTFLEDNEFIITAMDGGWDVNYQFLPQMNYNAWHKYTNAVPKNYPKGVQGWPGISNDWYDVPVTNYAEQVISRIQSNRDNGFRTIMDRPKIQYTTQGQRSDYQCEPQGYLADQDYSFYTYNIHETGNPEIDYSHNSVRVVHCRTVPANPLEDDPGYVVMGLKANREQANLQWNYTQRDSVYPWFVMPRIRIPVGISDNIPVCRIEVLDWDGNPVPDFPNGIDIIARYFKDNNGNYNGDYLEEFYFLPGQKSAIQIPKNQICSGTARNFWDWNQPDLIKTDFRVYWYGYCDMWIDYVRVENLPAHQLFNPNPSENWDNELIAETDLALADYQQTGYVPNNFYYEEFEFNTTPCIRYVNNLIKQRAALYNVDLSLMMNLNYDLYPRCWCSHQQQKHQLAFHF